MLDKLQGYFNNESNPPTFNIVQYSSKGPQNKVWNFHSKVSKKNIYYGYMLDSLESSICTDLDKLCAFHLKNRYKFYTVIYTSI